MTTHRPLQVTASPDRTWLAAHRTELAALLLEHGAILLRGLDVSTPDEVATISDALLGPRLHPVEHDAAQTHHGNGIYSVADGPPTDATCLHNTQSHATRFPHTLLLACLTAPTRGGAVTLGDSRRVVAALPPALADRFRSTGWELRRSYLDYLGVSWSDALRVNTRDEVDNYCHNNAITHTWHPDGGLTTSQVRPAFTKHPHTGEECWFNTILYFSRWSMEPDIRALLSETYGEARFPFDTYFGDGTPLTHEEAMSLDAAYRSAILREPWQAGDVLLVDNLRMAHGRDSYQGDREVVMALADPIDHPR